MSKMKKNPETELKKSLPVARKQCVVKRKGMQNDVLIKELRTFHECDYEYECETR